MPETNENKANASEDKEKTKSSDDTKSKEDSESSKEDKDLSKPENAISAALEIAADATNEISALDKKEDADSTDVAKATNNMFDSFEKNLDPDGEGKKVVDSAKKLVTAGGKALKDKKKDDKKGGSSSITTYGAFHFVVNIVDDIKSPTNGKNEAPNPDGGITLKCSSVSGLGSQIDTEEYIEGGENRFSYKLPKGTKCDNLKLTWALSTDNEQLLDWVNKAVKDLDITTKCLYVSLLNEEHKPVKWWEVYNAYPVKVSVSDFDASKNEIVIETLELAYQYIERHTGTVDKPSTDSKDSGKAKEGKKL